MRPTEDSSTMTVSSSVRPTLPPATPPRLTPEDEDFLGRPTAVHESARATAAVPRRNGFELLVRGLRRRLWILLLCVLVVPAAAFAWSSTRPKEYTATANLLLRDLDLAQKLFGSSSFAPTNDPQTVRNTNLRLVTLEAVAARAARKLRPLTTAEIQGMISVAPDGQSDLIGVSATGPDAKQSARVANTFAGEYITFRRSADRGQVESAIVLVRQNLARLTPEERTGPAGQQLVKQIQQLNVLAALQTGNAELVQLAGAPTVPSAPTPKRDAIVGLMAGLLLGMALAFLLERLDQRLKEAEDVEEAFGLPILTELPESRTFSGRKRSFVISDGPEAEAFALLRGSLRYFNVEREIHSVVVTSPAPQDGKTTVALNLAAAAARAGEDVLLIEADLRRPQLAHRLELPPSSGLSGALTRGGEIGEGLIGLELPAVAGGDGRGAVLEILPAGPLPPNPAQLLESAAMENLLEQAERLWDLVVIDTPPTSSVSDTLPLMRWASGVILVCRLGRTRRGAAALVRRQFDSMSAGPLGIVLNGAKGSSMAHYEYRSEAPAK